MNERLTEWLLWFLGVAVPPAGEGLQWRLEGVWTWRPAAVLFIAVFAVLSTALISWLYARERSTASRRARLLLAGLRLSALALVLLVMIFQLRLNFNRTSLPFLAIMLDESQSMAEVDSFDDAKLRADLEERRQRAKLPTTNRLDAAKAILLADDAALLRRLAQRYQLQIYAAGSTLRKLPAGADERLSALAQLEPSAQASRHGSNVRAMLDDLRGTQPAAAIVMTDGIVTEGPKLSEIAPYARRKGVPLYLVGTGSESPVRGIELADLLVDDVVFVDDYVDLDFKLTANGLAGRTIVAVLKDKASGEVLSRKEVVAEATGQSQRVRLSHRPTKLGPMEYMIDVESPRDELKSEVIPLSRRVEVRKAKIKALLVQGAPSYEFRYLKSMLARDETIELKTVLQEADLEHAEQDRHALRVFPVGREELFQYDVIIFGDVDPSQLSPGILANVADFVKIRGGGLLMISGPQFNPVGYRETPLAALFPIDLRTAVVPADDATLTEPVPVRPTPLGLTSPHMQLGDSPAESEQIWNGLPEVYWFVEAPRLKPGARVLCEHPTRTGGDGRKLPLIVSEHVPPGKVIWHATDETYRWRQRIGDVLFARYWVQTIRYLARSAAAGEGGPVQLTSDRREYERGAPVQLRVRYFDERLAPAASDGVTVVLEGEGQQKRSIKLSREATSREIFTSSVTNLAVGSYHAWVAGPTAAGRSPASANFKIVSPHGEMARLEPDLGDLKAAAGASSGKFYRLADVGGLINDLPAGRATKVGALPPIPLWNNWRVLALFVGLLVCEWLLRKRMGMI